MRQAQLGTISNPEQNFIDSLWLFHYVPGTILRPLRYIKENPQLRLPNSPGVGITSLRFYKWENEAQRW